MNRYSFLTILVTDKFKTVYIIPQERFSCRWWPHGHSFAGQHGYFSQPLGKGNPHEYLRSNMKIIWSVFARQVHFERYQMYLTRKKKCYLQSQWITKLKCKESVAKGQNPLLMGGTWWVDEIRYLFYKWMAINTTRIRGSHTKDQLSRYSKFWIHHYMVKAQYCKWIVELWGCG